jgi:hypothetical protein
MNWEGSEWKRPWAISRYQLVVCLEELNLFVAVRAWTAIGFRHRKIQSQALLQEATCSAIKGNRRTGLTLVNAQCGGNRRREIRRNVEEEADKRTRMKREANMKRNEREEEDTDLPSEKIQRYYIRTGM